jgi:peptidoglycan/xylan/chitin deacetylase (PgdA/CDA1 family)
VNHIGCLLVAMLALGGGEPAAAKGWPTPAAGESTSEGPEVLFTFDDGPNPRTTPLVLDILARYRVRAVFFLVGEMADSRSAKVAAILRRILREGHVIATHTMKHKDLCRVPEDVAAQDLDDGKATVELAAGVPTAWFRAPFGTRCERLERLLVDRRLAHFHWDLDPQEWKHNDAGKAVRYVTGELARRAGRAGRDVLLLHDIKPATVKALPQIFRWIEAENGRRARAHKPPIRILQAPALASERLPAGLVAWLGDATAGARALPAAIASVLP